MNYATLLKKMPLEDISEWIDEFFRFESASDYKTPAGYSMVLDVLEYAEPDLVPSVINQLSKYGVDLNTPFKNGSNALHMALSYELEYCTQNYGSVSIEWFQISKTLIDNGVNELALDENFYQPRDIAAVYGELTLTLYDEISRIDWSSELSLDEFHHQSKEALEAAGLSVILKERDYISVALNKTDHDIFDKRRFFASNENYGVRHRKGWQERIAKPFLKRFKST